MTKRFVSFVGSNSRVHFMLRYGVADMYVRQNGDPEHLTELSAYRWDPRCGQDRILLTNPNPGKRRPGDRFE